MPFSTSIIAAVLDDGWKNEFHGICPQCAEMFILRRPNTLGIKVDFSTIQCTNCTAYFDSDLLKQIRAFLQEKPNEESPA